MIRLCPVLCFLVLCAAASACAAVVAPPVTRRDDVREKLHGVEVSDPYRWLEDQESAETRAWIEAQNAFTTSALSAVPGKAQIKKRLTELLRTEAVGIPFERGGWYFFSKRKADQDLAVLYRRKGLSGVDEVLVDPHGMSADHTTSAGFMDVTEDGTLMAYSVRKGGVDEVEVRLRDLKSGRDLPDVLEPARYMAVSVKPDRSGFYYVRHDAAGPRARYHALGSEPSADVEIFGKGIGPEKGMNAGLSEDGRYLLFEVWHGSAAPKVEVYLQNVAEAGPIIPVVNDLDARFDASVVDDRLYLQTNWDAPNGRVLLADAKNPARAGWKEIVPEGKAAIEGYSLAGGKLFVTYLDNVASKTTMFTADGKKIGDVPLPAIGSAGAPAGSWKGHESFFSFVSFTYPTTIYRFDTESRKRELWYRTEVPVDPDGLEVKQVWYPSKDGTKVPMFLVHAKGLKRDGARPTFLTGYGGFTQSQTPRFSSFAAMWAETGGVYALPALRGGGEFGEAWHRAGMLEKKQNTFDDFIGAAEWLIKNRYTSPDKLAISGGSNGGLLVGAALTQRPELFKAVVCSWPLLDMVRYHRFLVARFWVPEYGSADSAEQFRTIYSYSPYHRVKPGTKYPAVLFVTGDGDTRVAPLHARKMAALLQASTRSERPILLRYDTKAGHSGGRPLGKLIDDLTEEFLFVYWQLGATPPGETPRAR